MVTPASRPFSCPALPHQVDQLGVAAIYDRNSQMIKVARTLVTAGFR
jgi:hypothetical protein